MTVKESPHEEYDRGFSNGWDACAARAQPRQAEAVPAIYVSRGQLENLKPDPEDEAGTYLPVRKTPKGKFTHPLFAAPQQAEAVPSDVVRDAERLNWLLMQVSGKEFRRIGVEYSGNCQRADIDAALAQQKGASHE